MQLSRLAGNFLRTKKSSLLGRYLNIQPPKGGWKIIPNLPIPEGVSTHSRLKAADRPSYSILLVVLVSTHSRPKAAGIAQDRFMRSYDVSTHSRPKAAGRCVVPLYMG